MFKLLSLALLGVAAQSRSKRSDYSEKALGSAITNLPGLPPNVDYNMFSGYVTVDETNGRNVFYWFVESLNDPINDPVFFWTNGGPGCSGLGGFFTEQGPFRVNKNMSLSVNPYAWINNASGIFVEQPAGVGFSYQDVKTSTGDMQAASDNYEFIKGWLDTFDNYKSNDFYITSESYGGHYMPTLARDIVKNDIDNSINFKGVFVGNPYTDPVENAKGMYDTWWGHQMISKPAYDRWYQHCQDGESSGALCYKAEIELNEEIGDIDSYALDFPTCKDPALTSERYHFLRHVVRDTQGRPIPKVYMAMAEEHDAMLKDDLFPSSSYEPCAENYATKYLNLAKVQDSIHVYYPNGNHTVWTLCSETLRYNYSDSDTRMEPVWDWLVKNSDLQITVVSGDDDSVCGSLGTQYWMWAMGYPAKHDSNWHAWIVDNQVAGYHTAFDLSGVTDTKATFALVTVHSAGHMIPQTQPKRSLQSFLSFLDGTF